MEDVDAQRAELEAVLAALPEAVLVFDAAGRLRLNTQAAVRIFGGHLPQAIDELWARVSIDGGGEVDQDAQSDEPVGLDPLPAPQHP